MRFPSLFSILLVLFLLFPGNLYSQSPVQAEWTLMFYMDSDNDLELPQMIDLLEMAEVGSSAAVNIIVLADRHASGDEDNNYTNADIGGIKNWTTAKYLRVEKGKLKEGADLGELNMGDPNNLVAFIENAAKDFPAKKYALVFGNHGSGWPGILHDEGNGDDSLNMTELNAALARATKATGKLELIGFDACLMANFEVARTVSPYAKYMVASEELEPGDGWNYVAIMNGLTANPTMDGKALGEGITRSYKNFYTAGAEANRKASITLSLLDLSKIDALNTAFAALTVRNQSIVRSGRDGLIRTARARSVTANFGSRGQGPAAAEFFDMGHYVQNLKTLAPDPETKKAADDVMAALSAAVVSNVFGAAHPRATGLSLYFPNDPQQLSQSGYSKHPFQQGMKWNGMLTDIATILAGDTAKPVITPVQSSKPNLAKDGVVTVSAKVNADDIEEATFIIAEEHDDQSIIIGSVPTEPDEKGNLIEEWDGSWFSIGDATKEVICPITDFAEIDEGKDIYYVEVPAEVRYKGRKEWNRITLYFVIDFNDEEASGEFVYAIIETKSGQREVKLDKGDSIRPVYLSIDENGDAEEVASTDAADILNITDKEDLYVGNMDVAPGDYSIGFLITDFAGNVSDKFVEVTIE